MVNKRGPKPGPRKFDAEKHCGAPARSRGKAPCTRGKGERTDHPGYGRCWIHGGRNQVKHGLASNLYANSPRLREAIERVREEVKDPMDLSPELELLRGLLRDFTGRHEDLKEALISWNQSFSPAMQTLMTATEPSAIVGALEAVRQSIAKRPGQIVDVESAGKLAAEVGKMVERVHKLKQTSAVTYEAVTLLLEQMGMVLLKHMKDPQVVAAIQRDWGEINIPVVPNR